MHCTLVQQLTPCQLVPKLTGQSQLPIPYYKLIAAIKDRVFFINYVANFGTQIVYIFLSLPRKVL